MITGNVLCNKKNRTERKRGVNLSVRQNRVEKELTTLILNQYKNYNLAESTALKLDNLYLD